MVHTGLNRGANEGMTRMLNTKFRIGGYRLLALSLGLLMALTSVSTAFAVERSTSFPSQTEGTAAVGSNQSVKISQSASWNAGGEPGGATLTLTYTGAEAQVPGVQQHDYAILIDCSQSPDPIALWNACVSFVTQINKNKQEGQGCLVLRAVGER